MSMHAYQYPTLLQNPKIQWSDVPLDNKLYEIYLNTETCRWSGFEMTPIENDPYASVPITEARAIGIARIRNLVLDKG